MQSSFQEKWDYDHMDVVWKKNQVYFTFSEIADKATE